MSKPIDDYDITRSMLLTIQIVALLMEIFCGWLSTKIELPTGVEIFWVTIILLCMVGILLTSYLQKKNYEKDI